MTQVYLEHEVLNNAYEIYNADEYVEQIFNTSLGREVQASDKNLDLLLGVQGWRQGFFIYQNLQNWIDQFNSLTDDVKVAIQNLIGEFRDYSLMNNINNGPNGFPIEVNAAAVGGNAVGAGVGFAVAAPAALIDLAAAGAGSGSSSAAGQ